MHSSSRRIGLTFIVYLIFLMSLSTLSSSVGDYCGPQTVRAGSASCLDCSGYQCSGYPSGPVWPYYAVCDWECGCFDQRSNYACDNGVPSFGQCAYYVCGGGNPECETLCKCGSLFRCANGIPSDISCAGQLCPSSIPACDYQCACYTSQSPAFYYCSTGKPTVNPFCMSYVCGSGNYLCECECSCTNELYPPGTGIVLDVGNDTSVPFEWSRPSAFTGSEFTPDFSTILNQILSANCSCVGCFKSGDYCNIPFNFHSNNPGQMIISNISITYNTSEVMHSVSYGQPFQISQGCIWLIRHAGGQRIVRVPASYTGSRVCRYLPPGSCGYPTYYDDAMIDAVYRLLFSMDSNQDCIVDDNIATWSFQTHGSITVQSLWGPAVVKLVVWI